MLRMLIENSMFQNVNISRSNEYLRPELCHRTPGVQMKSPETGEVVFRPTGVIFIFDKNEHFGTKFGINIGVKVKKLIKLQFLSEHDD